MLSDVSHAGHPHICSIANSKRLIPMIAATNLILAGEGGFCAQRFARKSQRGFMPLP